MPRCQSCGAMTNAQDAKHCGKCGASLSGAAVYKECKNLHQYQGDHCPHCPTPGAMAQAGPGRGPRGAPPTKVESGDHGKGRGGMPVYQGKTEVKPRKPPWDDGTRVGQVKGQGPKRLVGWLVVLESETEPRFKDFPLDDGRNTIRRAGKGPCMVGIVDPDISGEKAHAMLDHDDGVYFFKDNDSTHGTRVNSKMIRETVELQDGDRIKVGTTVLVFRSFPYGE